MKLFAHLLNDNGIRREQSLQDHCIQAAKYAAESLENTGFCHTAYLAGLIHDMGKATCRYNDYIERAFRGENVEKGSVNHTFAGVIWLMEKYHTDTASPYQKLTCEIIAFAAGSHHGMFDCVDLDGENGFKYRLEKDREEICYEEAVRNYFSQVTSEQEIDTYFTRAVKEVQEFFNSAKSIFKNGDKVFFAVGMLARLVLASVIYGDRRDTREFMSQKLDSGSDYKIKSEDSDCEELKNDESKNRDIGSEDWSRWREYFEEKASGLDSSTEMNQIRQKISDQCLAAAGRPCGIYRLNVPTGGGKTLSALRYALAHAEKYKKKRIIFIIPLISVLDQNVKVIRDYIPEKDKLLEHHSNVVREPDREQKEKDDVEELDRYEFLTENWEAPVIVSTLVQLLNILFTHQPSAIGRMRALCDSVIVIDEVQSLPKKVVAMFNMAVNFLQQYCNTTVLLSSATQPCFEETMWPLRLGTNPDIVRLEEKDLRVFKRAEIINKVDAHGMEMDDLSGFCCELMEQHSSLLTVCNTKEEARKFYEKVKESDYEQEWDAYHLSNAMCQQHREDVLKEILEKLEKLQEGVRQHKPVRKLICVSTQLVEAGIDFSFEGVVRILAGIDNIAQVTGRCNRSNEYGFPGKVYLVKLKNEKLGGLSEISDAQHSTEGVLELYKQRKGESIIGEWAVKKFYQRLFKAFKEKLKYPFKEKEGREGTTWYMADLLANRFINLCDETGRKNNEGYMLWQPFKTAGKKFTVFDQDTIDVIVPYKQGREIIDQLRKMQGAPFASEKIREVLQQAKKYTVSIFEYQKNKLDNAGMLEKLFDGRVLILNEKAYDEEGCGLVNIEELPVGDFFV